MNEKNLDLLHICHCDECQQESAGAISKLHLAINQIIATLDEKNRRRFAGLWALEVGHGGIHYVSIITGLDRKTIRRGLSELRAGIELDDTRIRAVGASRKGTEKKSQRF